MPLKIIVPPEIFPVTLAEAKQHLRVDDSDNDDKIELCIQAATRYADGPRGFLARALITQTWELVLDRFPDFEMQIPLPPLQEVLSVKYDDTAGDEQTLSADDYSVDNVSEPGWIVPVTSGWPTILEAINTVRVRFIAGYAPTDGISPVNLAENVPQDIKAAILLHVGALYEHRETTVVGSTAVQLPWGAEQLLRAHRMHLGMA